MSAWIVDTNVAVIANGGHDGASLDCVASCAEALQQVMQAGVLFVDDGQGESEIVAEYRTHLDARGQPGPGDAFLKWVLTREWSEEVVERIAITKTGDSYAELPPEASVIDPSDRKFVAVATVTKNRYPEVLQGLDSKWVGWRDVLDRLGVSVKFLCEDEIRSTFAKKFPRGPKKQKTDRG